MDLLSHVGGSIGDEAVKEHGLKISLSLTLQISPASDSTFLLCWCGSIGFADFALCMSL